VKGHGQNCCNENLPPSIARLWFEMFVKYGNPTKVLSAPNMHVDKIEMAAKGKSALSES